MLEVRYELKTGTITGWCGDPKQFGNLKLKGGDGIIILDIPVPNKTIKALKISQGKLTDNLDYQEPAVRDIWAEIKGLKQKVASLEAKQVGRNA